MSTDRLPKEAVLSEEATDPLLQALGKERDRCCDELGIPPCPSIKRLSLSSDRCPVKRKCHRLWGMAANLGPCNLTLKQYRQFSQKFYALKQERDRILQQKSVKLTKEE